MTINSKYNDDYNDNNNSNNINNNNFSILAGADPKEMGMLSTDS